MNAAQRLALLQGNTGGLDFESKILVMAYVLSGCGFDYHRLLHDHGVQHETVQQWLKDYEQCKFAAAAAKRPERHDDVVAMVMARKGSTGLPDKALRDFNGLKVIGHTLKACRSSRRINKFVVTTDSPDIAAYAEGFGAHIVLRPSELGVNFLDLRVVMSHARLALAARHDYWPDIVLNLFPTHPFRTSESLDAAIDNLVEHKHAAFITRKPIPQVRGKRIYFKAKGIFQPFTVLSRSKTYYCQLGAINVFNEKANSGNYFYQDISGLEAIDIDTPADLSFAKRCLTPHPTERFDKPCPLRVQKRRDETWAHFVACVVVNSDRVFHGVHPAQNILELLRGLGLDQVVLTGSKKHVIKRLSKIYPEAALEVGTLVNAAGWPMRHRLEKSLSMTAFHGGPIHSIYSNIVTLDTSLPGITAEMFLANIHQFQTNHCRPTVSISRMPSEFHLYKLSTMQRRKLTPVHANNYAYRQLYPTLYIEDGLVRCARIGDLTATSPGMVMPGAANEDALLMETTDDPFTSLKILTHSEMLEQFNPILQENKLDNSEL